MGIFVIIPIAVVIVLILSAAYVKAPPNRAAVITGLRKKPRVLLGKAGFKIPFFERVDWMEVGQIDIDIETEDYIPTQDFINIRVDAIAQVSIDVEHGMDIAMRNFLNKKQDSVKSTIAKSLQGNLREIIGTMNLKDICQNKAEFSEQVKANAEGDIAELGIKILSFNVQNIKDKDGLIDDLGIDNREQIRKSASIAKAEAEKEVAIAQAKADNEANIEKVKSQTEIAKRENELSINKANLKISEDTAKANADAAYKIQEETARKDIEITTQNADIAKREKEIELQAREAEALDKKAEAMQKYGQAAILEMLVGVLPDMAKAVAEPISAISDVKIIGGDSNGVSGVSGNVPIILAQVMESVKEATGVDMKEIIRANSYDAKL